MVSNYMPIQIPNGTWSSPFEQVYHVKPDWRNLVPVFSVAYIKRFRDAQIYRASVDSETIQAICIGNDLLSDDLLFYLPRTKQEVSSAAYTLDPSLPSGPVFGLHYDGKLHWQT